MFSIEATYYLFNALVIIVPVLCWIASRTGMKFFCRLGYLLLAFVAVIRYDIGADYNAYVAKFDSMAEEISSHTVLLSDLIYDEPFSYLLSFCFQHCAHPSTWVIGAYFLLTLLFIYLALERYKAHALGLLVFIVSYVYFDTWDWIRQALSMAIFLYAIRHIEDGRFVRYLICIGLAAAAHYSALILLPFYFVRYIRLSPKTCALTALIFLLVVVPFSDTIRNILFRIVPYYSQLYADTAYSEQGGNTSTTFYLSTLVLILTIYMSDSKHSALTLLLTIGVLFKIVAMGNLNISRVAWYFTATEMILASTIWHESTYKIRRIGIIGIMFVHFVLLNFVFIPNRFRWVVPYETIFSTEYEQQVFRSRDWLKE